MLSDIEKRPPPEEYANRYLVRGNCVGVYYRNYVSHPRFRDYIAVKVIYRRSKIDDRIKNVSFIDVWPRDEILVCDKLDRALEHI